MAPRKANTTPKGSIQNLFPDMPFEGGPEPDKTDVKADTETQIASLLGRIEQLSQSVSSLQETNSALLSRPQVVYAEPQYVAPQQDQGMPDPLENPDAFTNVLTERILNRVNDLMNEDRRAQDNVSAAQNASDELWEDFSGSYSHWEDYPDQIGYIAQKVLDDAKKKGKDPERYVFVTRDQYFKDIDAKARQMFGHLLEDGDDGSDDSDTDRSGGVWPGQGAPMPRPSQKQSMGTDMIVEIQKLQKESGFY